MLLFGVRSVGLWASWGVLGGQLRDPPKTNTSTRARWAMQSLISPVTKAILVALFIFAILLILYVILWYICRDVDCDHGI